MIRRALPLLVAALLGCTPDAPIFTEALLPGDTRDPLGPYAVFALTTGLVDRADVRWQVGDGPEQSASLDRGADGAWRGELPGAPFGAQIAVWLTARGAGGETRFPLDTAHRFAVRLPDAACLVDGDCLPGEICDRLRLTCRAPIEPCADDGDCPIDTFCPQPGERCRFRPLVCRADTDCPPGRACLADACVDAPTCADDADCPTGARCLDPPGRCSFVDACRADADCPAERPICRAGRCEVGGPEACAAPCAPGTRCLAEQARCVACFADGHCPGGHCDLDRFVCADGPRGLPCVPCSADRPCGAGFVCPRGSAICLPACPQGACPAGFACRDGACTPDDDGRYCGGLDCGADADCESGVCRSGLCEPRQPCTADFDCADDRQCLDGTCRPRDAFCDRARDCPADRICLAGRCVAGSPAGVCAPCVGPEDCQSPALCVATDATGPRCVALCGGGGCPGGLDCVEVDRGLALCLDADLLCAPARCGADANEPNETFATGTEVQLGQQVVARICAADVDVYLLPQGAIGIIEASTDVALTLTLRDRTGAAFRQIALPPGGSARIEIGVDARAIEAATAGPEAEYRLSFQAPIAACVDDRFEPNDRAADATTLGGGADIRCTLCPANIDWYFIRRPNPVGGEVVIEPEDGALIDAWLRLDGDDQPSVRSGDAMRLQFTGDVADVRVALRCADCPAGLRYHLTTQLGAAMCFDDPIEPNDAAEDARRLAVPFDQSELVVCAGFEDWFIFARSRGVAVRVRADFVHARGDIDLEVSAANGRYRDDSTGVNDREEVVIPAAAPTGDYRVRVWLAEPGTNEYRLLVEPQ
ncbi:MAG: hypothetical protein KC620_02305 [Myxococcales bacterium]|nr:hypothetical protein [Myxococcales bacterium]